ncbi:1-acyl-sn-glycerol-3-phosphate acyltransferase [Corynebacterium capitovis DSM 44611]|uniref:lysophospholipid acyltransferase family protein n=1 Tax=Corynebacterium capitovis TaxID=131081 RepID=UPI00036FC9DA|nr:lysophospholipid acyltransferase family protein [Corynebacterium capitovis]WKD57346.1 1-acyl-sn-glycerol-3-phosphate acyltransferase [Corynebacterium capitovis DSM 44611]
MLNKWYVFFKVVIGPPLYLWNRPAIRGAKNIPAQGAAILASNHQAVLDSFYLPLMVWRQITFPAKKEYFTGTGLGGAIQRFFFSSVGQIPIDRSDEGAGQTLQVAAKNVLGRGDLFGIYPEGTRSPDGRIYKGKTGMARIAMETGAPVVPVAMIGTREANPIGSLIPRPRKVHINVGEAVDPHEWARRNGFDPGSREVMRPFTDFVMARLSELSGYNYVDVYAADVKKSLEEGRGYPDGAAPAAG